MARKRYDMLLVPRLALTLGVILFRFKNYNRAKYYLKMFKDICIRQNDIIGSVIGYKKLSQLY